MQPKPMADTSRIPSFLRPIMIAVGGSLSSVGEGETMRLEFVSIDTGTYPLDGVLYRPEADAGKGAILIMHGNCGNFYTGVLRHVAPSSGAIGLSRAHF